LHSPNERQHWGLELSMRIVGRQDRVAVSLLESQTPGFSVFDLRGYWQMTDDWLWLAGVENVGNRTYREHLDYRALEGPIQQLRPGMNVYVGSQLAY